MENLNDYAVIGGPSSEKLAKKIAQKLNAKYLKTKIRDFPDGESQITVIGNSEKRKIIVVQSTHPPVNTNIIHSLFLVAKAREMSSEVCVVVPYMGYAKQDKEFLKGEIISLSVIVKLIQSAGATRIIVVDFHSSDALEFFKIPVKNLSAVNLFVQYFKKLHLNTPLVVSPDLFWKENSEKLH
jgi:ribose-phosphate pyrophosphokinase